MKRLYMGRETLCRNFSVQVGAQCCTNHCCCSHAGLLSGLTFCHYLPGIDVNIVDQKGLRALDTVKDMPSKKSREIAALIHGKNKTHSRELQGKYRWILL